MSGNTRGRHETVTKPAPAKGKSKGKKPKRPEQPRLRNVFGKKNAAWLILEPHRVGLLVGTAAATLLLTVQFVRQLRGGLVMLESLLIGALTLFVVSYGAAGIFVWYLLYVRERELQPEAPPPASHHLHGRKGEGHEAAESLPVAPAVDAAPDTPEKDENP